MEGTCIFLRTFPSVLDHEWEFLCHCVLFRRVFCLLAFSLDDIQGVLNDGVIEVWRVLIAFQYSLCFLHALMKKLPWTASTVNSVHKSWYHRTLVLLWCKSMIVHYEASVSGFVVPGWWQLSIIVDDFHVKEWYGTILFSFDGEFQGWVQVVDCSQFLFDIYSFDVPDDVIHVSGIQHSFSFNGIVKLAHPANGEMRRRWTAHCETIYLLIITIMCWHENISWGLF